MGMGKVILTVFLTYCTYIQHSLSSFLQDLQHQKVLQNNTATVTEKLN